MKGGEVRREQQGSGTSISSFLLLLTYRFRDKINVMHTLLTPCVYHQPLLYKLNGVLI